VLVLAVLAAPTVQDPQVAHMAVVVAHVMMTQTVRVVPAAKALFVLSGAQVELILQQAQRMYSNVRSLRWLYRRKKKNFNRFYYVKI
jgi:hypothetical protein